MFKWYAFIHYLQNMAPTNDKQNERRTGKTSSPPVPLGGSLYVQNLECLLITLTRQFFNFVPPMTDQQRL